MPNTSAPPTALETARASEPTVTLESRGHSVAGRAVGIPPPRPCHPRASLWLAGTRGQRPRGQERPHRREPGCKGVTSTAAQPEVFLHRRSPWPLVTVSARRGENVSPTLDPGPHTLSKAMWRGAQTEGGRRPARLSEGWVQPSRCPGGEPGIRAPVPTDQGWAWEEGPGLGP